MYGEDLWKSWRGEWGGGSRSTLFKGVELILFQSAVYKPRSARGGGEGGREGEDGQRLMLLLFPVNEGIPLNFTDHP